MKKRIFKVLLTASVILTAFPTSGFAFSDIGSSPYASAITKLKEQGIVSGQQDGKFLPEETMSFAAGLTLIAKALDLRLPDYKNDDNVALTFPNIKENKWYSDAFKIASKHQLHVPTDVKAEQVMTKEQFAHLLQQAIETTGSYAYIEIYMSFKDENAVTKQNMNSIQHLLVSDIVQLDSTQQFHPKQHILRGEAASWIQAARKFVADNASPVIQPKPDLGTLYNYAWEVRAVNDHVNEVILKADAPHPGFGMRIQSIVFDGETATIIPQVIAPDPNRMYPQVITSIQSKTYVEATYKINFPDEIKNLAVQLPEESVSKD